MTPVAQTHTELDALLARVKDQVKACELTEAEIWQTTKDIRSTSEEKVILFSYWAEACSWKRLSREPALRA